MSSLVFNLIRVKFKKFKSNKWSQNEINEIYTKKKKNNNLVIIMYIWQLNQYLRSIFNDDFKFYEVALIDVDWIYSSF